MTDFGVIMWVLGVAAIAVLLWNSVKIVPQQQSWLVERFGRYNQSLSAGLNFIIPFVDRIAYNFSLKEDVIDVSEQVAITQDNVSLKIDGVLYVRIFDSKLAAYGVSNPYVAISQLAQTTMRSEIGKITLDRTFEEREMLNANIVSSINQASAEWGIRCMRYEIKDITPPPSILESMELQMTAERKKRAQILESEGHKTAQINIAEARKQETVLQSEAAREDQINRARGEADAIRSVSEATSDGIRIVAKAIVEQGGRDAVSLRVAEQYVAAFAKLAKTGNTLIVPADTANPGGMIAQALTVFDAVRKDKT